MNQKYLERVEAAVYLTEQRGLRTSKNTLQKYATTRRRACLSPVW